MGDNDEKNIPLDRQSIDKNIPLNLEVYFQGHNRLRRKAKAILGLAIRQYKSNGRGITYTDLLSNRLVSSKKQAQTVLKYYLRTNLLFTLDDCRPQQYYPACFKSEIFEKNIPIDPSGVGYFSDDLSRYSLEGYILPLLPKAPFYIHNLHLRTQVPRECYQEIPTTAIADLRNKGKEHEELIGRVRVRYCLYANGTIDVTTQSSSAPFRLQEELDLGRLIAFLSQVRDRLVLFLSDRHERLVPDIMEWRLTQWDLNKDIVVPDYLQASGLNIQLNHFGQLFRIYLKPMGRDTVCRIERSFHSNRSAIEVIESIFRQASGSEKGDLQ